MAEDPASAPGPDPAPAPTAPIVPPLPSPLPAPAATLSATTSLDSAAAMAAPSTGKKGQGNKKGKGPVRKTKPPAGGAAFPAMALTSAVAPSSQAVPSTSSGGAPSLTSRAYAQVAAAPLHATAPSAPTATSGTIPGGRDPFPSLTRRHGVRCLLVSASPHVETYVWALARVIGPTAIVAASKMYGKVVFFLASEAAAQEAVEKGMAVGGRVRCPRIPGGLGRTGGIDLRPALPAQRCPVACPLHLGKPISIISPLPLGCKDPALRHILSFRRQVQIQVLPATRDGVVLEGSFLVPYQGAHYRVHYLTGEARCFL
ncbi:unnamed protein product [Eretmochelys imbricata]